MGVFVQSKSKSKVLAGAKSGSAWGRLFYKGHFVFANVIMALSVSVLSSYAWSAQLLELFPVDNMNSIQCGAKQCFMRLGARHRVQISKSLYNFIVQYGAGSRLAISKPSWFPGYHTMRARAVLSRYSGRLALASGERFPSYDLPIDAKVDGKACRYKNIYDTCEISIISETESLLEVFLMTGDFYQKFKVSSPRPYIYVDRDRMVRAMAIYPNHLLLN